MSKEGGKFTYAANNQLGPYYEYSVARNMLETLAKQK